MSPGGIVPHETSFETFVFVFSIICVGVQQGLRVQQTGRLLRVPRYIILAVKSFIFGFLSWRTFAVSCLVVVRNCLSFPPNRVTNRLRHYVSFLVSNWNIILFLLYVIGNMGELYTFIDANFAKQDNTL